MNRSILCDILQSFIWIIPVSFDMCWFFQEYPYLCQFYYRNDREGNRTFSQISGDQHKINQQTWNLAHVEQKYCCFFTENFVRKFYFDKKLR